MDILENISTIYSKFGIMGLLLGIIIVLIVGFLFEIVRGLGKKIGERKKEEFIDLSKHIFFNNYDYFIKVRIPQIKIECPLRKKLFSKLLVMKANSYKNSFAQLSKKNLNDLNPELLSLELLETIGNASIQWKEEAIREGVPIIVCSKLSEEISQIKQFINQYIKSVCHSATSGNSNHEKIATVMDFVWSMEEFIIGELEKTLNNLNGDISNIKTSEFKCLKCSECKTHKKINS